MPEYLLFYIVLKMMYYPARACSFKLYIRTLDVKLVLVIGKSTEK